ncbi:MAG TPA: hypothetical protein VLH38_05720 [Patescibacteria group bacterium]|nr:hypothetical protein [Patescibacteria group bacterium]
MNHTESTPAELISPQAAGSFEMPSAILPDLTHEPGDFVTVAETLPNEIRAEAFARFRRERRLGVHDTAMRLMIEDTTDVLTGVIVDSIQQGRTDTARELLSASKREPEQIRRYIKKASIDEVSKQSLQDTALALHRQKVEAFRSSMAERGFSDDPNDAASLTNRLLEFSRDPEAALDVPDTFWPTFKALPANLQNSIIASEYPLATVAECIPILAEHGMLFSASRVINYIASIEGHEAREAYAIALVEAHRQVDTAATSGVERFENPLEAHHLAKELGLTVNALYGALGPPGLDTIARRLNSQSVHFLRQANTVLAAKHINTGKHLLTVVNALTGSDDDTHRAQILNGLQQLHEMTAEDYADEVARAKNPVQVAAVVNALSKNLDRMPIVLRGDLFNLLESPSDSLDIARRFMAAYSTLEKRSIALVHKAPVSDLRTLLTTITKLPEAVAQVHLEDYIEIFEIGEEYRHKLLDYLPRQIAQEPHLPPDDLEGYPRLEAMLRRLGIPDSLAETLYGSWRCFSATAEALELSGKTNSEDLTTAEINKGAEAKIRSIKRQIEAVKNYVYAYGLDELITIHQTFNTANFGRVDMDQLHRQLLRWQNPEERVKTIYASAYPSHNTALDDDGRKAMQLFGEDGTFWFECDGKTELAQVMVSVGDRDRNYKHNPLVNPTVETVVISGHGYPNGIEIGVHDLLDTTDYAEAAKEGRKLEARPHTYDRHIGNRYRLILAACETAGEPSVGRNNEPSDKNIAQTLHDWHGATVHGSEHALEGASSFEILPDGTVLFDSGQIEGQTSGRVYS